jgi:hypothetical protein
MKKLHLLSAVALSVISGCALGLEGVKMPEPGTGPGTPKTGEPTGPGTPKMEDTTGTVKKMMPLPDKGPDKDKDEDEDKGVGSDLDKYKKMHISIFEETDPFSDVKKDPVPTETEKALDDQVKYSKLVKNNPWVENLVEQVNTTTEDENIPVEDILDYMAFAIDNTDTMNFLLSNRTFIEDKDNQTFIGNKENQNLLVIPQIQGLLTEMAQALLSNEELLSMYVSVLANKSFQTLMKDRNFINLLGLLNSDAWKTLTNDKNRTTFAMLRNNPELLRNLEVKEEPEEVKIPSKTQPPRKRKYVSKKKQLSSTLGKDSRTLGNTDDDNKDKKPSSFTEDNDSRTLGNTDDDKDRKPSHYSSDNDGDQDDEKYYENSRTNNQDGDDYRKFGWKKNDQDRWIDKKGLIIPRPEEKAKNGNRVYEFSILNGWVDKGSINSRYKDLPEYSKYNKAGESDNRKKN